MEIRQGVQPSAAEKALDFESWANFCAFGFLPSEEDPDSCCGLEHRDELYSLRKPQPLVDVCGQFLCKAACFQHLSKSHGASGSWAIDEGNRGS
jgi:hypothetical protein